MANGVQLGIRGFGRISFVGGDAPVNEADGFFQDVSSYAAHTYCSDHLVVQYREASGNVIESRAHFPYEAGLSTMSPSQLLILPPSLREPQRISSFCS